MTRLRAWTRTLVSYRLLGLIALSMGAAIPAGAFQVGQLFGTGLLGGQQNHESITLHALLDYAYPGGAAPVTFSNSAQNDVIKANVETDTKFKDDPSAHFDDEEFSESIDRLNGYQTQIAKVAVRGDYLMARQDLGTALHTVQDFYAHSSWVDQGHVGQASLWKTLTGPATVQLPQSATQTCSPSGLVSVLGGPTSGFWDLSQLLHLPGRTYQTGSGASAKCNHGYVNSSEIVITPGIAKDRTSNPLYFQASLLASQATEQYIADVVALIGSIAGSREAKAEAICGLLDQPTALCVSGAFAGTYTVVLPLQGPVWAPAFSTINQLSFDLTLSSSGTAFATHFATQCAACIPFGFDTAWPLYLYGACTADGQNGCGAPGTEKVTLLFKAVGAGGNDSADQCLVNITLASNNDTVTATALAGSKCDFVGKGIQYVLQNDTPVPWTAP